MFCILKTEEGKKRLFQKAVPFYVKRTAIPEKAVFDEITVLRYKNKADWQAVRRHIAGHYGAVLFSDGFSPEAGSRIFEFKSEKLRSLMKVNTAVEILKESGRNPNTLSVAVLDRNGRFSGYIERIVLHAARVTVMTENTVKYSIFADSMLEKYGAVIRLIPSVGKSINADITVNLQGGNESDFLISLPTGKVAMNCGSFTFPERYREYLPDGVDGYAFLSVLFSLCFVSDLNEMRFDTLIVGGREISLQSAGEMLDIGGIF